MDEIQFGKDVYAASRKVPFLSPDNVAASFLHSSSNLSLKWSLRNSTAIKVRAEAGIYHVIRGTLPLNIPFIPSLRHIVLTASNQPLYLRDLRGSIAYTHYLELRSTKPVVKSKIALEITYSRRLMII